MPNNKFILLGLFVLKFKGVKDMKKVFAVILILFFSMFSFTGCNQGNIITKETNTEPNHLIYELTVDNIWYFFSTKGLMEINPPVSSGTAQYSRESLKYEIAGLLTNAVYDNVIIILEFRAVSYSNPDICYMGSYALKLNVIGNGKCTFSPEYIPSDVVPSFSSENGFSNYIRTIEVKSISGRVIIW